MKISEREKKELAIRRYEEALRRNQYSLTTTTSNGNNVWKTVGLILFGIIGIGCLTGVVYLIGQNSGRRNNYKCKC